MERQGIPTLGSFKFGKYAAGGYSSSSDSDAEEDEDEFSMLSRHGGDDDDEFVTHKNRRKRRRTGRDARESAALGIFGSETDEDDRRGAYQRKKLRKGVNFVASGKKARDSDDDEDGEEDEEEKEPKKNDGVDADQEDESHDKPGSIPKAAVMDDDDDGGVGLEFRGFQRADGTPASSVPRVNQALHPRSLAWSVGSTQSASTKPRPTFDARNPLGTSFIPTSATQPVLNVKDEAPSMPRTATASAFSQDRGGPTKIKAQSFGARMMAKMGYVKGQGLGKEATGRIVVVEAKTRPDRIGLGAVKEKTEKERLEERRQREMRGEALSDKEEEKRSMTAIRKKKASKVAGGSGTGSRRPRAKKILTVDEMKKATPGLHIPDAFTSILDMTVPGSKMLTSSSGIMAPAESRKITRRAQNDLLAISEEWQSLQERKAYLNLQLWQEQQELDELDKRLASNRAVANACADLSHVPESGERCRKADSAWKLNRIIECLEAANRLMSGSGLARLERLEDRVASLAVAAIFPPLQGYLQEWEPLQEPKPAFVDRLLSLRTLLGLDQTRPQGSPTRNATAYESMMYTLWLPTVASCVREWSVRDAEPMLALLEGWTDLLPGFVRTQLLEHIVRRLEDAVVKWQPRRKKSSGDLPHTCIFPWLPYLSPHHSDPGSATGLVAAVRRKFRQLIGVWDFGHGVVPGLKEWKAVLANTNRADDHWAALVMHHVLPSLARCLTRFRVAPHDQKGMDVLDGVLAWIELLGPGMVGEVLVVELFPKWHDVLYRWLLLDDVSYDELGQWFQWWQDLLPEEIRALDSVQAEFERGARMIEEALDLGADAKDRLKPPARGPAWPVEASSRIKDKEGAKLPDKNKLAEHRQGESATFRHAMEDWCQANDLQFIPERKRVHAEGWPLYRITARGDGKGGVLVWFRGDVLYTDTPDGAVASIRRDNEADYVSLWSWAS